MVEHTKEQEIALAVIETYPEIDEDSPSSYILFDNDFTTTKAHTLEACHGNLPYQNFNVYDQLITAVPNSSPEALAYLTFLIEGPFSRWRKQIALKSLDDEFYLLVTGLDTFPANVLFNFCIASRVPIEFKTVLPVWMKLREAGVPEAMAFLCATCVIPLFRADDEDRVPSEPDPLKWVLVGLPRSSTHLWLEPTSDWSTVLNAWPLETLFSEPYKFNPNAGKPCNVIWGTGDRAVLSSFEGKTVRQIMDYFNPDISLPPIVPSEQPPLPMVELDLEEEDEDADELGWYDDYDPSDDEFYNEFGYDEVDEL